MFGHITNWRFGSMLHVTGQISRSNTCTEKWICDFFHYFRVLSQELFNTEPTIVTRSGALYSVSQTYTLQLNNITDFGLFTIQCSIAQIQLDISQYDKSANYDVTIVGTYLYLSFNIGNISCLLTYFYVYFHAGYIYTCICKWTTTLFVIIVHTDETVKRKERTRVMSLPSISLRGDVIYESNIICIVQKAMFLIYGVNDMT